MYFRESVVTETIEAVYFIEKGRRRGQAGEELIPCFEAGS